MIKLSKSSFQIKCLALILNLLILRTAIPYLEYVFIALNVLFIPIIYLNIKAIKDQKVEIKSTLILSPYIITSIIFLISFIKTTNHSSLLLREFLICLYFIYYLALAIFIIKNDNEIEEYIQSLKKQIIIITLIAAVLGILKLLLEFLGFKIQFLFSNGLYPFGTSLKSDHNFFSLSLLLGLILYLGYLLKDLKKNNIQNYALYVFSITIILSSSRRGIVILTIIYLIIVLKSLLSKTKKNTLTNISKHVLLFITSIIIFFLGTFFFVKKIGNPDFEIRQNIAVLYYDYSTILSNRTNINTIYHKIWGRDYIEDCKEKNTQFQNSRKNLAKVLENLKINSEIKEINQIENKLGWQLYLASNTEKLNIGGTKLLRIQGFQPNAGIYRFIEVDPNLTKIYISLNYKIEKWNKEERIEIRWKDIVKFINIPEKNHDGHWHNKNFTIPIDSTSIFQLLLRFSGQSIEQYGSIIINNLTVSSEPIVSTSIIFLNKIQIPQSNRDYNKYYELKVEPKVWYSNGNINYGTVPFAKEKVLYTYLDSMEGSIFKDFKIPGSQFWEFSAKVFVISAKRNLRLEIMNLSNNNYCGKRYDFLNYKNSKEWQKLSSLIHARKGDSIRLSIRHFYDTVPQLVLWKDITFNSYKKNIAKSHTVDTVPIFNRKLILDLVNNRKIEQQTKIESEKKSIYPRLVRWQYAISLFNRYSFIKKLTGSGFYYLDDYKNEFSKKNQVFDYPHNIFLSALLYSGIIGLIFLIWLIVDVTRLYIRLKIKYLLYVWTTVLLYVLFSSNSIYELPLLTGFIVLPYIIQYKKKNLNNKK